MDVGHELFTIWLTCKLNFSPKISEYLKEMTPMEIYDMKEDRIERYNLPECLLDKNLNRAKLILEICKQKRIHPIAYNFSAYPEILKKQEGMPAVIYVKGDIYTLNDGLRVGIVGTRGSTPYGEACTEHLARSLADSGAVIISGGAAGIDTCALRAAVMQKKKAIAVLGCDIDKCYPASNYSLFSLIESNGAIISEYPPGTNAHYFPARNRLIAAMSERLVVGEAPQKSGALITAQYASDYGVPVFACVSEGESFAGCRDLVERGAWQMTGYETVLNCSTPVKLKKATKRKNTSDTQKTIEKSPVKRTGIPLHDYVIDCITDGRDTVNKMTGGDFRINEILSALTCLELEGVIASLPGDRYKLI